MAEKLKIYTKTGCPYCAAAKEYYTGEGIPFDEINVTDQPDKLKELLNLAPERIVPVIVEGDKVTVGFGGG